MDSLEVSRRPVPKWAERLKEFVDRMVRLELREEPKIRRPLRIPRKHGVIMPSIRGTISEKRASLTVLIDTSGSMIRPGVMGYVKAAVLRAVQNGLRVRLIAGDVAVTVDEEIKGTFPTLIGGGGTDIRPLFERARKYRPSSVVILTDGYVLEWPEDMGIPLLWLRPAKDSDRQKPDWKRVEIIEVED
jgi:predicted metal-dependent peptidase